MHVTASISYVDFLVDGAAIVNSRGVPGSIGFAARTRHDAQLVVVTSFHVLNQETASGRGVVSLALLPVTAEDTMRAGPRIGRAGWGRRGIVQFANGTTTERVFLDCAVVMLEANTLAHQPVRAAEDDTPAIRDPIEGMRVTKTGAATGTTRGVIVDANHAAAARIDGRPCAAPKQILVQSAVRGRPFCGPGDSGSVLRDEQGSIVGLIWGVSASGHGLACPIGPVLWLLQVEPVLLPGSGRSILPEAIA